MQVKNFNLRVYGLLLVNKKVLITHEHRGGMIMTKFPGGGVEKGEGLKDALVREFMEELNLKVEAGKLFYVNDFLQISYFNPADQVLSFYYWVTTKNPEKIEVSAFKSALNPNDQIVDWVELNNLNEQDFTFPIDQCVVKQLKELT